jgi:hypothetical protein
LGTNQAASYRTKKSNKKKKIKDFSNGTKEKTRATL